MKSKLIWGIILTVVGGLLFLPASINILINFIDVLDMGYSSAFLFGYLIGSGLVLIIYGGMILAGILLICSYNKDRKFLNYLMNDPMHSIPNAAVFAKVRPQGAAQTVEKYIRKGLIPNCFYVNYMNGTLQMRQDVPNNPVQ